MNAFMKRLEYLTHMAKEQGGKWKLEYSDGSIKFYNAIEAYIELLQCSVSETEFPRVENVGGTETPADKLIEKLLM